MKVVSFFFVGLEVDIQGVWLSYYYFYDGSVFNEDWVQQVLDWLELLEVECLYMIIFYFFDMDDIGYCYGFFDDEVICVVLMKLDWVLGELFDGVEVLGLFVNIIMVFDYGMIDVGFEKFVNIDFLL